MKFEVTEDLVFNEPLPSGGDTKIVLKKGTIVEYISPSKMERHDQDWFSSLSKRASLPTWNRSGSSPQRTIPFKWRGKVRIADTPNDLKPVSMGGLIRRFR